MLNTVDLILVKSTKIKDFLKSVSTISGPKNPKLEIAQNSRYNNYIHKLFKLSSRMYFNNRTNNIIVHTKEAYRVFELIHKLDIPNI